MQSGAGDADERRDGGDTPGEGGTPMDGTHSFALIEDEQSDGAVVAETLCAMAEQIAVALDCTECCIYEYLPERDALRGQAIWAVSLDDEDRRWIASVNNLGRLPGFRQAVASRELFVSYPDDDADAAMHGPESMSYWGELAAMYAPIVRDDEVLGVLELTEKHRHRQFTREEQQLVRRMADLAAVALSNARQTHAAMVRNRQLQALIDSSRAMSSTLELDEVLDVVCRQATLALDAQSSYIYQYHAGDDTLEWMAFHHRDTWRVVDEPLHSVYRLCDMPQDRTVIHERIPVQACIDDPGLDPVLRDQLRRWEEQTSLMVPLVAGDEVVGALEVSEADYVRRFSGEEIELCRALGEQAAIAIRNAQLYRRLREQNEIIERQATTDGLTGLLNHRAFYERLRHEVARARRYGFPLSLVMLDLDNFKQVNDRHGHPGGDQVLREVGAILRGQLRADLDIAARYGGEEFAVILPHTGSSADESLADGGRAVGERIREAVAVHPVQVEGIELRLTASVGLATLPAHAVEADSLVSCADEALYQAKRAGKDRVEVYGPV
jgi:diguanylate cyclase (GGDEF)-like protein